jgi:deazaflavin-dependent oxidoreductase (nitroreductase family)
MIDWSRLNPEVIDEFRANGGKVARFGDLPVVILHTIGARSGKLLEVPLIVVRDGEEMLLFASSAGAKKHPAWVHNLRAHPRITVETGSERYEADVVELPEPERRRRVELQAKQTPQFADYVSSAAPREIPAFSIERVDPKG